MSLVSPMTNEITLYAAECAHVTHLYMKVAGGHLGTDLGGGKRRKGGIMLWAWISKKWFYYGPWRMKGEEAKNMLGTRLGESGFRNC